MSRGGPQVIPRPDDWGPGGAAPWAHIPESERIVTIADLRRAFTGRVGAPSVAEAGATTRGSAVLAPFYEEAGELWVVLTRRSWTLRAHTGEVAFPGGRIEPGESAPDAALREACEEVALDPAAVEILGELDHLMTITSSSFIVPFVGVLDSGRPQLVPSPGEVDAVLHVPVAELLRDDVFTAEQWRFTAADIERSIFFFALDEDTLWGATAAMLRHLLALALDVPTGIDHA